jgi:hypothetical protein
MEKSGKCRVHLCKLNQEDIRKEIVRTEEIRPSELRYEYDSRCNDISHSNYCEANFMPEDCIEDQLHKAQRKKKGLEDSHLLRECARNPREADKLGESSLRGMLQQSPILCDR